MKKSKIFLFVSLLSFGILSAQISKEADFSHFSAINDPVLNKVAEAIPVDKITPPETQEIIKQMVEISKIYRKPDSPSFMVGLAAPQVGISKRIILADLKTTRQGKHVEPLAVYINPEIIWSSEGKTEETFEGCFSAGKAVGIVPRHKKIKVRAYNEKGELIEKTFENFTARIMQHEIDHLNGIRFPERVQDENKLHWVENDELNEYRISFPNWKKTISQAEWKKIAGKS